MVSTHFKWKIAIIHLIFSAVFIMVSASACTFASPPKKPLTQVTVQLAWTHQSQFAGLYAADLKGYYSDEGLKVTFIPGGANIDKLTPVIDGTAQFSIANPDELILARADGKPVKAIATVFRRSPVVFISLAEKNITRPQDFVGKIINSSANIKQTLLVMMSNIGVTPDQYSTVNLPSDVTRFVNGDTDIWGAFINGFPIVVEQAGYKINIIYPDDYGVHFSSDTIFTSDALATSNPDLVLHFLRASLKGWSYIVENSTEAPSMVQKYNPDSDPIIELARINATIPLVNTGIDHIGWMKPEIWVNAEDALRKYSILTKPMDTTQVYTLQFLQEIYK